MDALQEIQEDLMEFLKDVDDKTFVGFVDSMVFHVGTDDGKVTELCTRFLEEQDIKEEYLDYVRMMKLPKKPLFIGNMASVEIIEKIKQSLLALSHNRFRNYV